MSLDVYLELPGEKSKPDSGIFVRENGSTKEISREEWNSKFPGQEPVTYSSGESSYVYSRNITHNLGKMADASGIYQALWRPEEIEISLAHQLEPLLEKGLKTLKDNPEKFKAFNPENGWGSYEGLVDFVDDYLKACKKFPAAKVVVSG